MGKACVCVCERERERAGLSGLENRQRGMDGRKNGDREASSCSRTIPPNIKSAVMDWIGSLIRSVHVQTNRFDSHKTRSYRDVVGTR